MQNSNSPKQRSHQPRSFAEIAEESFYRFRRPTFENGAFLNTGSPALNFALGGPGIGRGKVIEVAAPETELTTRVLLNICQAVVENGGSHRTQGVLFLDMTQSLNAHQLQRVGLLAADPEQTVDGFVVYSPTTLVEIDHLLTEVMACEVTPALVVVNGLYDALLGRYGRAKRVNAR